MPKPKAPEWLRLAFRDGVDERESACLVFEAAEDAVHPWCWLAQFDPAERPCSGKLERLHFINRQRVEHALGALLPRPDAAGDVLCGTCEGYSHIADACPDCEGQGLVKIDPAEVILLAAWDPRNGGIACEGHHRRLDSHLVPLPAERLVVPLDALPEHVHEFAADYGLEHELEARFSGAIDSLLDERVGEESA